MGIFKRKPDNISYPEEETLKPLNFDDDTAMDNLNSLKKELTTMYKPTRSCKLFSMDEDSKKWRVQSIDKEFPFSMILDFEIIENQKMILKHKSGVGGAVAGGLVFGAAGAVVGGLAGRKTDIDTVEDIQIRIITASPTYPVITISRINRDTANLIYAMLMQIAAINEAQNANAAVPINNSVNEIPESQPAPAPGISSADEIRKFKALLDDGIISQEEFDAKKKQLLGI